MMRRLLRHVAHRHGRALTLFRLACCPDGEEWAEVLRLHGGLHSMGEHCSIQTNVTITDPDYVRLGNNVRLSGCTLFGHDGSVNMVNRAFGLALDRVGMIDIGDNVFIGHAAIVLPGCVIGSNTIVGAGAVVTHDLYGDAVYCGSPARRIGSLDASVRRLKDEQASYPWHEMVERRGSDFDAAMEPELLRQRVAHFFGSESMG